MSHRLHQLATFLVLAVTLALGGCNAAIGDMGDGEQFGPSGNGSGDPNGPSEEEQLALCEGDGQAGAACEVSGDCTAPLVCLDNICVGPRDPDYACSNIEGVSCQGVDEVCVANVCVKNPGSCTLHDDCPLGYVCAGGQCTPERDGSACPNPGPGPDMTGSYALVSTLHLRDGLPGVVDGILDVAEDIRDIVNGDIDLGLPSAVEFVVGALVAGVIRAYVPSWGIDLVTALGDMSDMLDTMTIEGTMQIQGQACSGTYRVKEEWQWVSFDFRGQQLRFRPDNLPGVPGGTKLEPDEYAMLYSCGVLYFDRHRVQDTMSGLIRFLVDTVVNAATGYPDIETALPNIVDCWGIGYELDSIIAGACSFCPGVAGIAAGACQGFVQAGANKIGQEIDEAAVEMSLIKVKGTALVSETGAVTDGTWAGSLLGGDFPGEFSIQKN